MGGRRGRWAEKENKTERRRREKRILFNIHRFLPPHASRAPPPRPQLARKLAICGVFGKGGGVKAEPLKSLLPIAGGSLNKIRFKWQEPNFCKPPRSIFWLKLKDEY